ncbi:MAG: ABC transporter transmembrane domain-containing protein, partial [Pollutimonas bauzanensis]
MRSSLLMLLIAAALQGLALACITPIFLAIVHEPSSEQTVGWLGAFTLMALLATALRWRAQGFDYCGHMAQATHDLRMRLGAQLRRMPLEKLENRRAGEITTNLLGSVDEHMNYVVTVVNLILTAVVTPLITGVATLFLDWRLGLALLLLFPAIIPLYRRRRPALDAGMRATAQENERLSAEVVEYVQGLPVLRAACCAGAVNERLQQQFETLERVQRQSHRAGAKPNLLSASIFEVGLLAVVACGVLWVVQGTLDPVSLAAVVVVVVRFAEPLATFITYTTIFA